MSSETKLNSRRHRLLGICGSLRANSFSSAILEAMAEATAEDAVFDYADIGKLPHFNQDIYRDSLPETVQLFREQVSSAEGLVVVSPEYNHGIPGVLKNALDWASRPHNDSPLR